MHTFVKKDMFVWEADRPVDLQKQQESRRKRSIVYIVTHAL
jgi:hypothetical protein